MLHLHMTRKIAIFVDALKKKKYFRVETDLIIIIISGFYEEL